jgi:hypothetical protein
VGNHYTAGVRQFPSARNIFVNVNINSTFSIKKKSSGIPSFLCYESGTENGKIADDFLWTKNFVGNSEIPDAEKMT